MRRFKIELARDTRLIFTAWGLLLPQHYSLSVSVAVHTTTKTPRFTRKRCKMRYCAAILLFIALSETALAATCTYYRSSHRVTCGSVTCTTRPPSNSWWSRGSLPAGNYLIGRYGYRGNWFQLYRQRSSGGVLGLPHQDPGTGMPWRVCSPSW